jgi:thiol-disulfide isomerase/thioredoxin
MSEGQTKLSYLVAVLGSGSSMQHPMTQHTTQIRFEPSLVISHLCTSNMKLFMSLLFLFQASGASAEVLSLTGENILELTEGKSVFIKFFAPWCEVCQEMAPAFEKLAADWEGHPIGLVAEVDCTGEDSEVICDEYEIADLPTIYYGDRMSPEEYDGERTYEAMSAFAKEHISQLACSVKAMENCSKDKKKLLEGLLKKPTEELTAVETEVQKRLAVAQTEYDEIIKELNVKYEGAVKNFNGVIDDIRSETNYKWVQQVLLKREEDAASEL